MKVCNFFIYLLLCFYEYKNIYKDKKAYIKKGNFGGLI